MKKIFLTFAVSLLCATAHAQDTASPFTVSPLYPTGGGEVTLTYDNSLTPLAYSKTVTGVIYICDGEDWTVDDLDLTFADGLWRTSYTLPENSVIAACKFYGEDGEWDSGSAALQAYGMFVYGMNGDRPFRKPATWMQRSLLFSRSLDKYAIPGYLRDEYKIDDKDTYETMRWEAMTFPQMAESMIYYAALLQNSYEPGQHNETLRNDIDALLEYRETKEINLIRAAEIARTMLKDEDKARQLETIALERFPDGLLARDGEIRRIFNEKDREVRLASLEEFVERFPPQNFTKPQTRADEIFYSRLYWTVLRDMTERADFLDILKKYLPMMTYPDVAETYYRGVFLPYDKRVKTAAEIRPLADAVYAELIKRIDGGEDLFYQPGNARYSPRQWRETMMYNDGKIILGHARILMETGEQALALEVLEPLRPILDGKISVFNDVYTQLLVLNGYNSLVVPFIEECVLVDAATPEMLETLRADFAKKNPNGDFDRYLNGLRSKEYVTEMEQKLLNQLVSERVDLPVLESNRGGMVDLGELKGKVVFLDFWATWCAPCIAAMPGVKMAQDRYADNPDVAFYFVDTMERGASPEEIREGVPKVLEAKGFQDFHVLYDFTGHGYSAFSRKFRMNGIPQKVIIDQQGNVRWVSGGYFGNPLELANEIGFIIDHLINEKE